MSSYANCPACSSTKRKPYRKTDGREVAEVYVCGACGAVYGDCYLGESYEIVRPYFGPDPERPEDQRYYDFTTLGSRGIERRHGWFNPATRTVTQVG